MPAPASSGEIGCFNRTPESISPRVMLQIQSTHRSLRSCEENAWLAGLTGESACPTLIRKGLCFCGTGAFACQPIFSHHLTVAALFPIPSRDRQGAVQQPPQLGVACSSRELYANALSLVQSRTRR